MSFIGSSDEPALFVGGPCGGGTLDVEQGESGIRIVGAIWDPACTGSDLQTLFTADTGIDVTDDDTRREPHCVASHTETPDPVAESATPTTAPLRSSTARAWNVQWVANDERLDPGVVTFSVADLLQVTSEAAGCVFIGAQNPFC